MKRDNGVTLLEMLLVLILVAGILIYSLNRYVSYQRSLELRSVKSDVSHLMMALNQYYTNKGCHSDGVFAGSLTPSLKTLGIDPNDQQRLPLISSYNAAITQLPRAGKKPLYNLTITATFNDTLTDTRLDWLKGYLTAAERQNNKLTWTALPNTRTSAPRGQLWILQAGSLAYRQHTSLPQTQQRLATDSPAFCAD